MNDSTPPLSVEQALRIVIENAETTPVITESLHDALFCATTSAIDSDRDIPPFDRSIVDGYALVSSDFKRGIREFRIIGTILAGSNQTFHPESGECVQIMTGAVVPPGFDAVVMVEDSVANDQTVRFTGKLVEPWMNIARRGEDAKRGDLLLPERTTVDASTIPTITSCGYSRIPVHRKPTISLIATGDELVSIDEIPKAHQIRDVSSYSLEALLAYGGMTFRSKHLVKDVRNELEAAIREGLNSSILVITGGVSKGITDLVPEILTGLGIVQLFHRVNMKPGLPLWFGKSQTGGVVFGLPGNPVSSQVCFRIFVQTAIRRMMNLPEEIPLHLPILRSKTKKHRRTEYAPARLVLHDQKTCVEPISYNGSGDFFHIAGSHGLMLHPSDAERIDADMSVRFFLWNGF